MKYFPRAHNPTAVYHALRWSNAASCQVSKWHRQQLPSLRTKLVTWCSQRNHYLIDYGTISACTSVPMLLLEEQRSKDHPYVPFKNELSIEEKRRRDRRTLRDALQNPDLGILYAVWIWLRPIPDNNHRLWFEHFPSFLKQFDIM